MLKQIARKARCLRNPPGAGYPSRFRLLPYRHGSGARSGSHHPGVFGLGVRYSESGFTISVA